MTVCPEAHSAGRRALSPSSQVELKPFPILVPRVKSLSVVWTSFYSNSSRVFWITLFWAEDGLTAQAHKRFPVGFFLSRTR